MDHKVIHKLKFMINSIHIWELFIASF